MKRLILLLLMTNCLLSIKAQNSPNALVVKMKDGTSVTFLYEEQPLLKFTDDEIVVKTHMNEAAYPQSAVQKYVFTYSDPASIDSPKMDGVKLMGENIFVGNLISGTKVSLFSTDGKVIATEIADTNGNCTISLSGFPSGVYLLNYSDVSVKITKP